MRTMNIEMMHDQGARSVRQVNIIRRFRQDIAGARFWFAIHESPDSFQAPVLADYRSGRRIASLVLTATYIQGAPDYVTRARSRLAGLIEKHGAERIRAALENAERLN